MAIKILYEDKWLCLCIKEAGVLSEEGGMPELLKEQCGMAHYCVHRLDRAVGGLMVYARDSRTAGKLSTLVSNRDFEKEYLAIVHGRPENDSGIMRDLLFKDSAKNKSYVVTRMRKGVKEAELEYQVINSTEDLSLVKIKLHTGRSHQIRVQFASRKLPLLGDVKYGSTNKECNIALWSHRLSFKHPVTDKIIDIKEAPPAAAPWTDLLEV